ncbi:hypothetical protein [Achromobacter spanius]|uniref:Peptidase C39-like domain-containing protein n=1 Tax=Achromobacter spanius TaxID=217203 RepID=A0A2S0IBE3_9BURK|nr:hypothetical protein [Achromobacter spanius]AVJ29355.1 hypothetical protein CLM73_20840 [Achromobacter spanius]
MSPTPARVTVPYFCQWESAHRAGEIIRKELDLAHDPAWRDSGARDVDEYVRWASHVCGMACLKMVLAARTGRIHPTLTLARGSVPYGAYIEEPDGNIKGLIYAPFVRYVAEAFGLRAQVRVDLPASDLAGVMAQADYFMASVHPWIRWPDREPPKKGGHLVLMTRATRDSVTFHNPSGEPGSQADVELPLADFDRFYAGRGVAILAAG